MAAYSTWYKLFVNLNIQVMNMAFFYLVTAQEWVLS